jgi:c-di-GMP phosphodiesterase
MNQTAPRIHPALFENPQGKHRFFLARQPIVDRNRELVAYELLFRLTEAGPANVTDDIMATASVICHATELGLANVIGQYRGYINVDASALMSDFIRVLPHGQIVLEVLETVEVTDEIIQRVQHLSEAGFTFALDDVVAESEAVRRLLPFVDIIKCDVCMISDRELERLSRRFISAGKTLLAEKVETPEKFEQCLALGFDYFQGNFLAKPMIMTGTKRSPSAVTVMQLMTQILSHADADSLAHVIEQDSALKECLLELVARADFAGGHPVASIREALRLMGRRRLHRWLQIMLYAQTGQPGRSASPLLAKAAARGRLMELLAARLHPGERRIGDAAFTTGVMSLMDRLFGLPLGEMLTKLPADEGMRQALLKRHGTFGDMLRLVECLDEDSDQCDQIHVLLERLHLEPEDLYTLQVQAYEWSDRIAGLRAG